MNKELIRRWNEKVSKEDVVYHLGDFALTGREEFKSIIERLNGTVHLIVGNHEGPALDNRKYFKSIKDYLEIKVQDPDCKNGVQRIILFHYAMRVWRGDYRGSWHLYGHSHGNLPDPENSLSFDIGVDNHNFYPLSYVEVKEIMKQKKWIPPFAESEI